MEPAESAILDAALAAAKTATIRANAALIPALRAVERYVAGKQGEVYLSGETAERALLGEPREHPLSLHAPVPNTHARAIAQIVQKEAGGGETPLTKVVKVRTLIFNELVAVSLGTQELVRIALLPRASGARTADIIQASPVPAAWATGATLSAFGPELVLVQVYGEMCDPARSEGWARAAETERFLRAKLLKQAWGGGGDVGILAGDPYTEGGSSFAHGDARYCLTKLLPLTAELPVVSVRVADLAWVVEESSELPDGRRLERADLAAPILLGEAGARLVTLDGFHRLAAAMRAGLETLPARHVPAAMLESVRLAEPEPRCPCALGGTGPLPDDPDDRAAWGSTTPPHLEALALYEGGEETVFVAGGVAANGGRPRGFGSRQTRGSSVALSQAPKVAPVVASRLLKRALTDYAGGSGRVLVGDAAVDWKAAPRRLAFIAPGALGDEEEALRRALAPELAAGYELTSKTHDLQLPVDPRLRRLTLSVIQLETGARRPLIDVYNLPQYVLCPFFTAHHPGADQRLQIGTLPLVMRLLLADLWTVLILRRAGRLQPGVAAAAAADTLDSIRVAGRKLDLRLVGKLNPRKSGSPLVLPDYALVFPTEGRWYAGRVLSEELAAKRAMLGSSRRAGNYYPTREGERGPRNGDRGRGRGRGRGR